MARRRSDGTYEVGYGRPPVATRFKPGQPGNPRGRPKGAKNVDTILREILYRPVTITEDGKRRKVPALEVFLRKMLKGAIEGDPRAADKIVKLLPTVQASLDREAAAVDADAAAAARDDRAVLAALAEMLGTASGDFFLDDQMEEKDAQ